jgi:hypothetical protein
MWILIVALIAGPASSRRPPAPDVAKVKVLNLTEAELREQIEAYLGSIDTPISQARWAALGPKAGPILEEVIADPKALPTRRAKAVEGLAGAAPERAAQLLPQLAQSEDEPTVVRVRALDGAGRVLPPSKLIVAVKPVLEGASERGVRATAADVLARHGKAEGCDIVRAHAGRLSEGELPAFQRAVDRCK